MQSCLRSDHCVVLTLIPFIFYYALEVAAHVDLYQMGWSQSHSLFTVNTTGGVIY